jgi:TonB family protein
MMQITLRVCGLWLAGLIAAGLPSGVFAAETKAEWLKRPSQMEIVGAWPRKALQSGVGGSATVHCIVTALGGVRDCKVISEKPAGVGFGASALGLAEQFLFRPATRDGAPVETEITVPIRFEGIGVGTGSIIPGINSPLGPGVARVYSGPIAWSGAPTVADFLASYPPKARERKAGGHVLLDCKFTKSGRLSDCLTLSEEPRGLDFARAAVALADRFQGPTQDAEGNSMAGGHTQLSFAFAAQSLDTDSPMIGKPKWAAIPKASDVASLLPANAKAAGVLRAQVMLQCSVGEDGGLTHCAVETETPGDLGFGQSALTLAPHFRVGLWTEEGLPTVGGRLRLPLNFDFTDSAPSTKP